jgi:hypothetical protein
MQRASRLRMGTAGPSWKYKSPRGFLPRGLVTILSVLTTTRFSGNRQVLFSPPRSILTRKSGTLPVKILRTRFSGVQEQPSVTQLPDEMIARFPRAPALPGREVGQGLPLDEQAGQVPVPIVPGEEQMHRLWISIVIRLGVREAARRADVDVPPPVVRRRSLWGVVGERRRPRCTAPLPPLHHRLDRRAHGLVHYSAWNFQQRILSPHGTSRMA